MCANAIINTIVCNSQLCFSTFPPFIQMCIFQKPFFAISEGVFLILYKVRSFDFTLSDKINYYHLTQCVLKSRVCWQDSYSQGYGLPSDHVWLWELDDEEGRTLMNWCLWTVVLEKTPESPLDSKEIKPVNLKGNQPWILIGRKTDAEAEAPVFWSPDANSWPIGKVPDARKDWGQEEKRVPEGEMTRWHHWCNEHELRQTLGDGEGQGGLVCCSPWGCKQLGDWTAQSVFNFPSASSFSAASMIPTHP